MAETWAANASPFIILAKIGSLDLLLGLPARIAIPQGVLSEIAAGEPTDQACLAAKNLDRSLLVSVAEIHPSVAGWGLGRGESEVLTWALAHSGAEAIIDDREARAAAKSIGVPVRGTLGVVLAAKKRGKLRSIRPLIDAMLMAGLRLDDRIVAEALRLAGEAPR